MYDSFGYVKKLVAAGVPRQQAETQVEIMSDILISTFATKQDLKDLSVDLRAEVANTKSELKGEIASLRLELKTEMADLRTELKTEMADLRTELKTEMADLRTELKTEMAGLRTEFKSTTLAWGAMLASAVTIMIAAVGLMIRFLPPAT